MKEQRILSLLEEAIDDLRLTRQRIVLGSLYSSEELDEIEQHVFNIWRGLSSDRNEHRGEEAAFISIEKRLERIEAHLSSDRGGWCAYAGSGSDDFHPEFITGVKGQSNIELIAAAGKFVAEVQKATVEGTTVVIVDPYALSARDDGNKVTSIIEELKEITKNATFIYIYCRQDAVDENVKTDVKKLFGHKLKGILTGDIHDRFVFVGHDEKMKHSVVRPWKGEKSAVTANETMRYWRGVTFGASINGITKRPTYVLNLPAEDIDPLIIYFDGVMTKTN